MLTPALWYMYYNHRLRYFRLIVIQLKKNKWCSQDDQKRNAMKNANKKTERENYYIPEVGTAEKKERMLNY
jgi:predicted glycosyltransferase involved in capsule biosynthesis